MVFLEEMYMPLQNCIEANSSSKTSWSRIWDWFISEFFSQGTILSSWISLLLWRVLQQLSYSLIRQTVPPRPLSPDLLWISGLRRLQALDPCWEGGMEATRSQGSMLWGRVVFRQTPGLNVFYRELQAQLCAQPTLRLLLLYECFPPLTYFGVLLTHCSQMWEWDGVTASIRGRRPRARPSCCQELVDFLSVWPPGQSIKMREPICWSAHTALPAAVSSERAWKGEGVLAGRWGWGRCGKGRRYLGQDLDSLCMDEEEESFF